MSATRKRHGLEVRQLPESARRLAAEKAAKRDAYVARAQFSRTFADVLSGRFGGRWSVEWERGSTTAASRQKTDPARALGVADE